MGRVAAIDPDGNFITIDEEHRQSLEDDGGRVLTKQETAEQVADAAYAQKSTAEKLGSIASMAGPVPFAARAAYKLATGHGDEVVPTLPPQVESYAHGVSETFAGGLPTLAVRELARAGGGDAAAKQYVERVDTAREAYPTTHTLGGVAGLVGAVAAGGAGAPAAARAIPGTGISAAGAAIERGVEGALSGLASKGALGRAAVTGAKLATRGAFEGGAFSGIAAASDEELHDNPIFGEKLYSAVGHGALAGGVLGGALGFGGSLAASGASKAISRIKGGLSSVAADAAAPLALAEGAAPKVAEAAEAAVPAAKAPTRAAGVLDLLSKPEAAGRDIANEQAFKAVGGGFGLQTTRYAKQAAKYFPNGTRDLGEIGIRYGLIDVNPEASPLQAAWQAAKSGTPDAIVPKGQAALETVGKQIGEITDASGGARIPARKVQGVIDEVANSYAKQAGYGHVAEATQAYGSELRRVLDITDLDRDTVNLRDLLTQRKTLDRLVYQETKTLDPKGRVAALREVRGKLEGLISDTMENAAGDVGTEVRAKYNALKKDYHGLSILTEAAEDSAARAAKGSTFGLGEKFAAAQAVASGHFAAAPVLALGGKIIRERGNAAAAAFLTRAVDSGQLAGVVGKFNQRVSQAAAGVLKEAPEGAPRPTPRRIPRGPYRQEDAKREAAQQQAQAQAIVRWVGEAQANPSRIDDQLAKEAEVVGRAAGTKAADAYTATTLTALRFIAAHIPAKERRDPLDPRSVPPLTSEEAARLIRATKYAAHPETIFADFEKGKVTPEGIRAAKTFAPTSLEDFRTELRQHVEDHMMRGRRLSQSQRLRVDKLLESPAGADLRPAAIARLQANLSEGSQEPPPAPPATGNKPVNMKVQQSGFDAIEARQAG